VWGDAFKRVMPEQAFRMPAKLMNALLGGLRRDSQTGPEVTLRPRPQLLVPGVTLAVNDSGANVPWHGVCQFKEPVTARPEIRRFTKAGNAGDARLGVLLEPVRAGGVGRVAWAGGPWKALVTAGNAGRYLSGTNPAGWIGTEVAPTRQRWLRQISARTAAGWAWVMIEDGGLPQMIKAKADMAVDNTVYAAVYLSPAGVESGSLNVMRPNGITVPNGTVGFLGQTTTGVAMIIPASVAAGTEPRLIKAKVDMTSDGAGYSARYITRNGIEGTLISQICRPPGVPVLNGDVGYLGKDTTDGSLMFIPCHARSVGALPLVIEQRTSDPISPAVGRIWVRTDLT
jgi:hypothetical protein